MTRDDIIRMALEADPAGEDGRLYAIAELTPETLERFAALVAAAEREACAMYLERGVDLGGLAGHPGWQNYTADLLAGCAAAIRARGQEAPSSAP